MQRALVLALFMWTVVLTAWTVFEYRNYRVLNAMPRLSSSRTDSDIDLAKAAATLLKLKRAPVSPSNPGTNSQVTGLLMQAQEISAFIATNPPTDRKSEAIAFLKSTNRQAVLAASQSSIAVGSLGLVWTGSEAQTGQLPYQVGIVLSNYVPYAQRGYRCGGTLIAPLWVLTAGHCFEDDTQATDLQVYVGKLKLSDSPAVDCYCWYTVHKVFRSPDYKLTNTKYGQAIGGDVALLELNDSPIRPGVEFVQIVEKADETQILTVHLGTISGWGKTTSNPSTLSDSLQYGTVKMVTDTTCATSYGPGIVQADMVCANASPADACSGDSGGAVVLHPSGVNVASAGARVVPKANYVEGVVSWTYPPGGCPSKKPTVYARVPAFATWIHECMDKETCQSSLLASN
jgi:secreted trypsin-like serine protease